MSIQTEFATLPPIQSELKRVSAAPEGHLKAPFGYVVADASGFLYVKRTKEDVAYGWQLLLPVLVFSTKAELLAYEYYTHNSVAIVLGDTVPFDHGEGAGFFVFRSDDLSADDSATNKNHMRPDDITDDALPGRWMCFEQSSA